MVGRNKNRDGRCGVEMYSEPEKARGRAKPTGWLLLTVSVVSAAYQWLEGRQRRRL